MINILKDLKVFIVNNFAAGILRDFILLVGLV